MTAALHHACLDAPVAAMAAAGSEGQLTLCCLDPGGGMRRYQLPPSEAGWAALGSSVIAAEAVSLAEVRLPYIVWAQSVAFELDMLIFRAVQHASARQVACEQFGDARVARATQGAGACALALGPCGARLVLASGRGALVVPAASLAADGGCRTEPVGLAGARSSLLLLCETAAALRPAVPAHAGTPRGACIGPQPCKQAHRMRAARRASTACAGPPYCVALGSGGALIAAGGRKVALATVPGQAAPVSAPLRAAAPDESEAADDLDGPDAPDDPVLVRAIGHRRQLFSPTAARGGSSAGTASATALKARTRMQAEQPGPPPSPRAAAAAERQRAETAAAVQRLRERAAALAAAAAALPAGFRPAGRDMVVDEALAARLTAEGEPAASMHARRG